MSGHIWVAIQYTPIQVEEAENGDLHTFTTDLSDEIARDDSALGCWVCGVPLIPATFHSECDGAKNNVAGDLDKS